MKTHKDSYHVKPYQRHLWVGKVECGMIMMKESNNEIWDMIWVYILTCGIIVASYETTRAFAYDRRISVLWTRFLFCFLWVEFSEVVIAFFFITWYVPATKFVTRIFTLHITDWMRRNFIVAQPHIMFPILLTANAHAHISSSISFSLLFVLELCYLKPKISISI